MRSLALLPLLSLLLAACELTEVTVPAGEPRVIVQSVLSARASEQFVLVERSATGSVPGGPTEDAVPPGEPRIPIAGASVVLSHGGLCTPASDTLGPREPGSGIYVTSDLCPLAPGDRVQLRVETPDGEIVTGTTTVPGATAVSVGLATDSATFGYPFPRLPEPHRRYRLCSSDNRSSTLPIV